MINPIRKDNEVAAQIPTTPYFATNAALRIILDNAITLELAIEKMVCP